MVLASKPRFPILYGLYAIVSTTCQIPLWLLLYLPRAMRPHKKWSWMQAVRVTIFRLVVYHASIVQVRTKLPLTPFRKEGSRFVVMDPANERYIQDVARDSAITPGKTGGLWFPKRYDSAENSTGDVVLHFHGGAFVTGDARSDTDFLAAVLRKGVGASHVFLPAYRLSSNPNCRFPAALQDALASYVYLTQDLHIPASRIIVSGDSAGANLAITFIRYLEEHGDRIGLARPACAFLWSPWIDLERAADTQAILLNENRHTDYITAAFGSWGAHTYCPHDDPTNVHKRSSQWISPLNHPFKTEVPVWVQTGDAEVLYNDDVLFAKQMKAEGNTVGLEVTEAGVHDTILTGPVVGFSKQAYEAANNAKQFLAQNRRSTPAQKL